MEAVPVTLNAGPFSTWLDQTLAGLDSPAEADVACGTCVGCCSSSQFVHVEAHETDALAHIPADVLFQAPGSDGQLMGYDEDGRCPMLTTAGCSIYDHRPQACRTYDCRIFTATGVIPDQPLIRDRTERWRFEIADAAEQAQLDRVRDKAAELDGMSGLQRAVLAVRAQHR